MPDRQDPVVAFRACPGMRQRARFAGVNSTESDTVD